MDSKPSSDFLAAPCLAISAVLFFLGTGLAPSWALTWLAAIPVLWIAPRLSTWRAFFVAVAAYAIGGLNIWSYSRTVLPIGVVAFILLLSASLFGVTVLLHRKAAVQGKLWQAALIAPAFWVTIEYAVATLSIHGTFGNLGYSQMNFLPILQIASVTGIWGISFCILLFAATSATLLSRGSISAKIPLAAGVAIFLSCVLGFGTWRLATTPKNSTSIKVGLIASSSPENINPNSPADAQGVFQRYGDQVKSMSGQGVKLFVLPENSGPVTDASQPQVDTLFGDLAKEAGAYVAVGVARISPNVSWNQERLYSPQGDLVAAYNKHHLLPPFENVFTPDVKRAVFNAPSGKWGLQICKDLDFPRLSREYSQDGIGLLLVPAWDFVDDGWLHGRMAILRGVEGGFSIARSVKLGILTATDDRGRVLGESKTIGPVFATLVADVPVRHDTTFYSRFGNWFAGFCMALLAVMLFSIFQRTPNSDTSDKSLPVNRNNT